MKPKFLPALLVAVTAMFLLTSCNKKTNTQGRYIPATAAVILHVNASSVTEKLPWDEVKQERFQDAYTIFDVGFCQGALDTRDTASIRKKICIFYGEDSSGSYVAFEGAIKDASKFKTYNSNALKNGTASQKDGIEFLSSDKTTVSWDKDRFIVVTDAPPAANTEEMQDWMKKMDQKIDGDSMPPMPMPVPVTSTRNGVATATQLFALREDKSMAKNEKQRAVLQKALHFWINSECAEVSPQLPNQAG